MAVLTVMMLLCAIVASNALNPICTWLTPAKLAAALTGALDSGLTVCNNYTYAKVPLSMLDGVQYIQKRTSRPGQEEFRCGVNKMQTIFGSKIAVHTFKGIFPSTGPFEWKNLDVALNDGQFRTIQLNDPTVEITFDTVAFECNNGSVFALCLWDTTVAIPNYISMATYEQFPDAEVVKRLINTAEQSYAPVGNLIDVNQTGCPVEPYKPFTVFESIVLTLQIISSVSLCNSTGSPLI